MPKIVINRCYGGYGLSRRAVEALAERRALPTIEKYEHLYLVCPDGTELDPYDIPRDDPDLVAVVEQLGEDANNGFSELKIVTVPDNVNWFIEEYDGIEKVAERHQTWS
ncbi:hypothetical protein EB118_11020 [bacterium]|nr:hypothetical protein [bacterium]